MKITINTPLAKIAADLPEDQVKELLRIAISYATSGIETVCQPEEGPQEPAEAAQPSAPYKYPAPRTNAPTGPAKPSDAQTGYKGFLYIKCELCGTTKAFCAKTPTTAHRCFCGHLTPLKDLKQMNVKCKCGASYKYRTNLTDKITSMDCMSCGAPVDLEYHEKNGTYETIGRKASYE